MLNKGGAELQAEKSELISDEMSEKIIDTAGKLATTGGANNITVRSILKALGITNRVFYNRFHNIDEVLDRVWRNTSIEMRDVILSNFDENGDFFEQVNNVVSQILIMTYDIKMHFNQYAFESDSVSRENHDWWIREIKRLIDFAKSRKYIKDVDSEVLSYSIWCFCRGYNADAVGRGLPKEEALKNFKYSFAFLLEGLKA